MWGGGGGGLWLFITMTMRSGNPHGERTRIPVAAGCGHGWLAYLGRKKPRSLGGSHGGGVEKPRGVGTPRGGGEATVPKRAVANYKREGFRLRKKQRDRSQSQSGVGGGKGRARMGRPSFWAEGCGRSDGAEGAWWTLITVGGEVVWTKYKNYCREGARAKKRPAMTNENPRADDQRHCDPRGPCCCRGQEHGSSSGERTMTSGNPHKQ